MDRCVGGRKKKIVLPALSEAKGSEDFEHKMAGNASVPVLTDIGLKKIFQAWLDSGRDGIHKDKWENYVGWEEFNEWLMESKFGDAYRRRPDKGGHSFFDLLDALTKMKPAEKGSGKPIMMSHGQFVKEHKNLVKVLESGTPAQQRKEAQEQRAELKARGGSAPWRYANKAPAFFDYK